MVNFNEFWTKKTLVSLGLGQFLSLLITSTGFSSSELARRGINAPTSQSFLNYVLLAVVYGSIVLYRKKALKAKWYYYVLLAMVDVEANFLVVKAYQYTSLTSVMLLDCFSIPCVIILTWLFLKTKYRFRKFIGVAVCVAGLVVVVFSDVHASDRAKGSNPIKGDMLVIAGSMLYAISNVSEEFLVKSADRVELMAMLGLFGAVISACQISILERSELKSIHWSAGAVLPFIGFAAAMFLFYSSVPILLKISGSTMLNLSLLTSDMWAVLIRIFAYHEKVDWMYFIAFAAVAAGLLIYSGGDKEVVQLRADVADEDAERSKHFDEEADLGSSSRGKEKPKGIPPLPSPPHVLQSKSIDSGTKKPVDLSQSNNLSPFSSQPPPFSYKPAPSSSQTPWSSLDSPLHPSSIKPPQFSYDPPPSSSRVPSCSKPTLSPLSQLGARKQEINSKYVDPPHWHYRKG